MATLLDSHPTGNENGYIFLSESDNIAVGQTWLNENAINLHSCSFYVRRYNAIGNIFARLYSMTEGNLADGLPYGSPIATSNLVDATSIPNETDTLVTFTFAGNQRIALGSNTPYCVVITFETLDASIRILLDTTDGHAGNGFRTVDGIEWLDITGGSEVDCIFYVYGEAVDSSNQGNFFMMFYP